MATCDIGHWTILYSDIFTVDIDWNKKQKANEPLQNHTMQNSEVSEKLSSIHDEATLLASTMPWNSVNSIVKIVQKLTIVVHIVCHQMRLFQ